jgi:NAD(P)-dependent dehydrogenase (short-subunit alcohol dehydrogenase family)
MPCHSTSFHPDKGIPDLDDQVTLVTGGKVGLGFETIKHLAKHHPVRIYLAARPAETAEKADQEMRQFENVTPPISYLPLDLSSLVSIGNAVKIFEQSESRLVILINNAGITMTAKGLTQESYVRNKRYGSRLARSTSSTNFYANGSRQPLNSSFDTFFRIGGHVSRRYLQIRRAEDNHVQPQHAGTLLHFEDCKCPLQTCNVKKF